MSGSGQSKRSVYMEWAKTHSHARFNLATSGLISVPLSEFPVRLEDLEITEPGGYGYEPLQQRLARHNGVPEECVVAATGTSMANHLAMAAVLDPGDEVLVEQPVYGPLLDVAEYLQARVKRIPRRFETGFALELTELERAITKETRLIVLSNLHNPSGALMPAATLRTIGEMAQRVGARVLVDEVYLDLLFDPGAPFCFPIGQSIAASGDNPFIVTSSLTKVYGLSGLRCGWVLASPPLAKRLLPTCRSLSRRVHRPSMFRLWLRSIIGAASITASTAAMASARPIGPIRTMPSPARPAASTRMDSSSGPRSALISRPMPSYSESRAILTGRGWMAKARTGSAAPSF